MTVKTKKKDVIEAVTKKMIYHDWVERAVKRLERSYISASEGGDTRGLVIVGESGSGKTRLLEHFENKYPTVRQPEGLHVPVLYAEIPPKPTVKGLAEVLLFNLGDPLYDKGTETVKTIRLITLLKGVKTKLLMLDEFQHFIDQGSFKVQHHVADWLKLVVDKAKVCLVVTGLPSCKQVFQTNSQLKRRFQRPITLPRFDWLKEHHRSQFIGILNAMQELMPEIEFPNLTNEDMAFRFYCVTGGLIGRLANLFVEVVENAYMNKQWRITLPALKRAANDASYDLPREVINPFSNKANIEPSVEIINVVKRIGAKDEIDALPKKVKTKSSLSSVLKK